MYVVRCIIWVFLNLLLWLVLCQYDSNAALCSELKYAHRQSFKKYLFEFNKSWLSYRKDKVKLSFLVFAVAEK